jgi:hypothetical protein
MTLDEFLQNYPPPMQELANRLRALVKKTLPDVNEVVYSGWKLIGLRVPSGKSSAYVGYIEACSDHVHLGFEYGILLPDPKKILHGAGTQVRYLTIRRASDIRSKDFAELIRAATNMALNENKRTLLKLEQDARKAKK